MRFSTSGASCWLLVSPFLVVFNLTSALLPDQKNNGKNQDVGTTTMATDDFDETRVELIPKIAAAEEGDLFLGKYGKVHRLQTDQDATVSPAENGNKFARDYVRLHLANRESQSRRKRSVTNPDSSQRDLDLSASPYMEKTTTSSPLGEEGTLPPRRWWPIAGGAVATTADSPTPPVEIFYVIQNPAAMGGVSVVEAEVATSSASKSGSASVTAASRSGGGGSSGINDRSNDSGGSFSSSSLLADLRGHLVTEVRIPDRNGPLNLALSIPSSSSSSSPASSTSSSTASTVETSNIVTTRKGVISNVVTTSESVTLVTSDGAARRDGATPLRIVADSVDYHDVVFDERTDGDGSDGWEEEGRKREEPGEEDVEIVEMDDPEVEPAHRIRLEDGLEVGIAEAKTESESTTPEVKTSPIPPDAKDADGRPELRGTEPKQFTIKMKREKVKEMMLHAWNNYVLYAWGDNELRPLSKQPHRANIYGSARLGATIIDSLSTLYLMGLKREFEKGREWIATDFRMDYNAFVSVFETNIRILGGLLSAYAMSGYTIFKTKSIEVANKMLPAFDTPTGIPYGLVSLQTGARNNWMWAQGQSILAEFGTLHLEFVYLSNITGISVYAEKVKHIRNYLDKIRKPNGGLYPNYLDPQTGIWGTHHVSIGALGDSFYEYLLKSWIQTGKKDKQARRMYDDAMQRMSEVLFKRSLPSNLLYIAEYESGYLKHHMGHLACFSGGMFGLGAKGSPSEQKWLQIAKDLAFTCKQSYNRTATGIGPEGFDFSPHSSSIFSEAIATEYGSRYYALRPEVIETWLYLWRLTKNDIYRQWAWEFLRSLERFCRTPNGFSGIRDVYDVNTLKDNTQQSFFLAETLKYLYLIFSEDDTLPLDEWVFNTEAHPLPILHDYPEDNLSPEKSLMDSIGYSSESPLWINP